MSPLTTAIVIILLIGALLVLLAVQKRYQRVRGVAGGLILKIGPGVSHFHSDE